MNIKAILMVIMALAIMSCSGKKKGELISQNSRKKSR